MTDFTFSIPALQNQVHMLMEPLCKCSLSHVWPAATTRLHSPTQMGPSSKTQLKHHPFHEVLPWFPWHISPFGVTPYSLIYFYHRIYTFHCLHFFTPYSAINSRVGTMVMIITSSELSITHGVSIQKVSVE